MKLTKPPKRWVLALLIALSALTSLLGHRATGELRQLAQAVLAPLVARLTDGIQEFLRRHR